MFTYILTKHLIFQRYATSTAGRTADVSENPAFAIPVGRENSALRSFATHAAATMDNARTGLASACLVGTDGTVRWKAAREDALAMDNVEWPMMDIGSASASTDGMGLTALRLRSRSAMIARITIKVRNPL